MSDKTEKVEATLGEATLNLATDASTVQLDEPLKRGEKVIDCVALRKPGSGELRGINLMDLAQMEVDSLFKLLPRITTPPLSKNEVANLSPADLMQMGVIVSSFLLTKQQQADYPTA